MNGNHTERLSQEGECRNEEEYGLLERASSFAHGVLEEIEALAGTTACKSVQLVSIKLNDFRYSDDNPSSFFERINAHNKYFDACPYRLIGFGENCDGKVCAVLEQRLVHSVRLATKQEVHDEFIRLVSIQKIMASTTPMAFTISLMQSKVMCLWAMTDTSTL